MPNSKGNSPISCKISDVDHQKQCILYVNATKISNFEFALTVESYITVTIHTALKSTTKIKLLIAEICSSVLPIDDKLIVNFERNQIDFEFLDSDTIPSDSPVNCCTWPVIINDSNYVVSGLCAVCRHLIKSSSSTTIRKLLGFRNACLMSSSQMSIWTKFCEIDMIHTVDMCLRAPFKSCLNSGTLKIPKDLVRFEYHLKQPVKIHNIRKIQNDLGVDILEHTFSEGPFMTLSDIIIFICFEIFIKSCPIDYLEGVVPLVCKWFKTVIEQSSIQPLIFSVKNVNHPVKIWEIVLPEVDMIEKLGLYVSNSKSVHNFPVESSATVSACLNRVENSGILCTNSNENFGHQAFNWSHIPLEAHPFGGGLPNKRVNRKADQLASMIGALVMVVEFRRKLTIVDFCSGAGHLGILAALRLPQCRVILVENKEYSLQRAKTRVQHLRLKNVILLQANINHFRADFHVGVSLHACGIATDVVMKLCVENKADFICCPCCYGGLYQCDDEGMHYPRSAEFQKIFKKSCANEYLLLAHGADRTHDAANKKTAQGFACMDVIDTDRKLYAANYGYEVFLGKLHPLACTNKNNLIVGTFYERPVSTAGNLTSRFNR